MNLLMSKQMLTNYFSSYVDKKKEKSITACKHEYIAFEEHRTSSIYVLHRGILKLSTFLKDGKEFNIKLVAPGEIVTLLEDETTSIVSMPFTICSLSESAEIYLLDRLSFWQDVRSDVLLNEYVRLYYRKNLNIQIRKTCALTSNGKLSAVCNLLYELQNFFGKDSVNGRLIDLELSNEELGKFCGIHNASSFNRILRQLKDAKVIEVSSNKILICSLERLKNMGGSININF
ncbi:helix-turn-helix domain-containing protein [Candidatus Enterococcus ferrettii]|nr:Crp/Fnr family transcriptional regulator [Enterococcus sp. 665A]